MNGFISSKTCTKLKIRYSNSNHGVHKGNSHGENRGHDGAKTQLVGTRVILASNMEGSGTTTIILSTENVL